MLCAKQGSYRDRIQSSTPLERHLVLERGGGCPEGASQGWEFHVSSRESAGKEALRRGSDGSHEGTHVTGCHFVILGSMVVGENAQGVVWHERDNCSSRGLLLGPPKGGVVGYPNGR